MQHRFLIAFKNIVRKLVRRQYEWSIGIYMGCSPSSFISPEIIRNPILTARDVTDMQADIVADPFMVRENGIWHMFFEVMNNDEQRGKIGLATSENGFNWNYKKIILSESFHLSYPYVFRWNDHYYMVPETASANSIRLYKAINFPLEWSLEKVLIENVRFVDPSIFFYRNRWWMFTSVSLQNDTLNLYYSDELTGVWVKHPKSPVIKNNPKIARPGGRVVITDGKIFRYAQDCHQTYGKKLRIFEITELTETNYQEKYVNEGKALITNKEKWNRNGIHHIDPHKITDQKWIACIDGKRHQLVFGLR